MSKQAIAFCSVLALLLVLAAAPAASAQGLTTCHMNYDLKGWSLAIKSAHGEGTVTCDNGQQADVKITAKGAGLSAGKYEIRDGHGKFSQVSDISELFGSYAAASASAGVEKEAGGLAMTKGNVSLAIAGKGTGFDLSVAVERFTLTPRK
jgi:hypothetical protein